LNEFERDCSTPEAKGNASGVPRCAY
jgi:hypothetical protein